MKIQNTDINYLVEDLLETTVSIDTVKFVIGKVNGKIKVSILMENAETEELEIDELVDIIKNLTYLNKALNKANIYITKVENSDYTRTLEIVGENNFVWFKVYANKVFDLLEITDNYLSNLD